MSWSKTGPELATAAGLRLALSPDTQAQLRSRAPNDGETWTSLDGPCGRPARSRRLPVPGCCLDSLGTCCLDGTRNPSPVPCPSQTGGLRFRAVINRYAIARTGIANAMETSEAAGRQGGRLSQRCAYTRLSAGVCLGMCAHMQQFAVAAQAVHPVDWWMLLRRES